jgi:Na+/melibiose symporter-like transporter
VRPRELFKDVFGNRSLRYTMGVYVTGNVALAVAGAVMVYFMKYYMRFDDTQQSIAFAFLFACTIIYVPLVSKLSSLVGKRWAYIAAVAVWSLVQAVCSLLVRPGMHIVFYALVVLASGGIIAVTMTGWSMIPDVIEVDEYKTGQRREGMYFGVISFSRKVSVAAAVWLIGIFLSQIGYVPDRPQTEGALLGIRLLYAEGTSLFLIASIILAFLLPMTKRRHEALLEAIRYRKEGRAPDGTVLEEIKKIL